MERDKKIAWVARYKEEFAKTDFAFIFRCEKVASEDMNSLRAAIKNAGGKVSFVKNTLARIAADKTECESIVPLFKGVSVLVLPEQVGDEESYPAVVKSLTPFLKVHKKNMSLAGGVLQGKFMDGKELEMFGKMPTRMELMASIAFTLQYPLMNIADTIKRAGESK